MPTSLEPIRYDVATPFLLATPLATDEIKIFVSSGGELLSVRDRLEDLVNLASKVLALSETTLRLRVYRWEDMVARRAPEDGKTIDLFVESARKSHVTVVLLECQLKEGTRAEMEAVLAETKVQLVVLRFVPDAGCSGADSDIDEFLREHKDDLLYKVTGDKQSDTVWLILFEVIMQVLTDSLIQQAKQVYGRDRY